MVLAISAWVMALAMIAGLAAVIGAGVWLVSLAAAAVAGLVVTPSLRRMFVLALIPATLLTNSDVVPYAGRYVPAFTTIAALLVASRADLPRLVARARQLPTRLVILLAAYVAVMALTTITSTARELSLAYLAGSIVTLGVSFLIVPFVSPLVVEELISTLVVTGVVIVISGLVFAAAGSFQLYGKAVGLYFITEATVAGRPTGLLFFQDYGPFVGPETLPLALGVVGALYMRIRSSGRARVAWTAAGVTVLCGLLSTFSREGWLIVALACLALAFSSRAHGKVAIPALAVAGAMSILFVAGVTNTLGVIGRMDLVASWYGPNAASILLNPDVTQRGQAPSSAPAPPPAATVQQRTLREPCVAVEASGTATGPTVELKGSSSLLARLCLWETALRAIAHRPLTGFGPGTGADAIIPYFYGKSAGLSGASTHDTYLRVGVEMGLPGLLVYLALSSLAAWMAFGWLRAGVLRPEVVLAAGVLAITVAELTDALLFGGLSFPGFWLAMSVGLLARPPDAPPTQGSNGHATGSSRLATQTLRPPEPQHR